MLANARVSLWIHWDNNRECIKGERANKSTTASRLCVSSRFFYLDYIFWGDITVPLFFFCCCHAGKHTARWTFYLHPLTFFLLLFWIEIVSMEKNTVDFSQWFVVMPHIWHHVPSSRLTFLFDVSTYLTLVKSERERVVVRTAQHFQ